NGISLVKTSSTLNINTKFDFFEYSVNKGTYNNLSSFDFNLPSSSWAIEDINLNFSKVEFGSEIKAIEDIPANYAIINKFKDGLGVQLKIIDPTIIYGIEIYGNNESSESKPIYFQIKGYDDLTKAPNTQTYSPLRNLNMSFSLLPSWHRQTFSSPIFLPIGDYYIIIDGSSIGTSPKSDYFWYKNDINPKNPDLYSSSFNGGSWSMGSQGVTFLYRLIQKINSSVFPEEINMTTQINGNFYKVSNGYGEGNGYLKRSDINYHPNNEIVSFKIENNKTESLNFKLDYTLHINNLLNVESSVNIQFNDSIDWVVNPIITRVSNNHTIKFLLPRSWTNLNIIKNSINISSDIIIDPVTNYLIIPNSTIENSAEWEIRANSPNIQFIINAPITEYQAGQELSFSILSPLAGNYTLLLFNPADIVKYQTTKQILEEPSSPLEFSYIIPTNALEGDYIAYIFWNNETDAGVQSQTFFIEANLIPNELDFTLFIIIGSIVIGGMTIGYSSYVVVKKRESRKRDKLQTFLEQCNDVLNLKYIIVLHTKTGIDLYSQSFEEKQLDPTLISGFLQAIHNFGVEVIDGAKESRTVKVEYKNSIILMTEFINLRLIVIMKSNPSKNFLYSIESLAYHIYKYYSKLIESFEGDLRPFRSIQKLIDSDLNVSFRYPLRVSIPKEAKLNQNEKEMVKKATNFMKDYNLTYFYAIYLLPDNVCGPKDYETLLNLIKKGIFVPIKNNKD
ncbi:MAG: hypothetical protein ACFFFB_14520, partial [Candidatus Heimdallarchaeota archaeon]